MYIHCLGHLLPRPTHRRPFLRRVHYRSKEYFIVEKAEFKDRCFQMKEV
jgi:hypothetical protein